jgi:7-cyano-7-deazaguanine synthase in queuosine biosynthesis
MKQILLLNSGGFDSACLAKKLKDDGFEVHSLYIDYKVDNSEPTRISAQITADKFCVEHEVISVDFKQGYDHTPLQTPLCLAIGSTYAVEKDLMEVYSGSKADKEEGFTEDWNNLYRGFKLIRRTPTVILPLAKLVTYKEVADWAGVTKEDVAHTHSCRKTVKCGTCSKCLGVADGHL